MNKPKPTPGPWTHKTSAPNLEIWSNDGLIAVIPIGARHPSITDSDILNAMLISASVDFLYASNLLLERLKSSGEIPDGCVPAVMMLRMAIRKATGE